MRTKGTKKLMGHWETPIATLNTGEFLIHLTDSDNKERKDRWIKVRGPVPPTHTNTHAQSSVSGHP